MQCTAADRDNIDNGMPDIIQLNQEGLRQALDRTITFCGCSSQRSGAPSPFGCHRKAGYLGRGTLNPAAHILGDSLHLKVRSHLEAQVDQALREGQHANGCIEYKGYARWLGDSEVIDLRSNAAFLHDPGVFNRVDFVQSIERHKSNSEPRVR